jgi:hypothetical protein
LKLRVGVILPLTSIQFRWLSKVIHHGVVDGGVLRTGYSDVVPLLKEINQCGGTSVPFTCH